MLQICYNSTGTSFSHNNWLEGEVVDSRPTRYMCSLPIKKSIIQTKALFGWENEKWEDRECLCFPPCVLNYYYTLIIKSRTMENLGELCTFIVSLLFPFRAKAPMCKGKKNGGLGGKLHPPHFLSTPFSL